MAEKYGVPLNTLSPWIKNSSKIKQTFQSGNQNLARKRVKVGKYEDVSAALLKWFTNKMDQGAAISGPLMIEKAQKLLKTWAMKISSVHRAGLQASRRDTTISCVPFRVKRGL